LVRAIDEEEVAMARKGFRAFEEWQRHEHSRRLKAAAGRVPAGFEIRPGARLSVGTELAGDVSRSVVHECRAIALDWLQETVGARLPRKAWRFRPFAFAGEGVGCQAVRVRDRQRDLWSAQVKHMAARDQEVVTDISVACPHRNACHIAISVQDRSTLPADGVEAYPAGMLADLAECVPLMQGGRRLAPRPIFVDSDATMSAFIRLLVDPDRVIPFAVISATPEEDDPGELEAQARMLARSLTGLAVTWVLPAAMTYRLSDTVSKPLSVFLGAWRFYRPGFNEDARKTDHPLVLKNRMVDEYAVAGVVRMFVRMAAAETIRLAPAGDQPFAFDAIAREAAGVARGPARLVTFLRNSFGGGAYGDATQGYANAPAVAGGALHTDQGSAGGNNTGAPALVSEPSPASVNAQADPTSDPQALLRQLGSAKETVQQRTRQYERTRRRAEQAERERDEAVRRADQLAGLVRSMGGDPDATVPFPTTWDEFGDWCDECLAGRVTLTGSARRELSDAEFNDVGLAARCLHWLAGEYRDGRLRGGNPRLHGRIGEIAESVFNAPCGGDTFDCSWSGENHSVDWHIKVGGNTRDPRRCLRIYYFWDQDTQQVVVASMPGHRRSVLS